jgi:murein DD-endopeptidase MepM/ murein hydrolase activator NlpD
MTKDDSYAVWAMGQTLAKIKAYNGLQSWEDAAAYYFAGANYNTNWVDELGNSVQSYLYDANGGVVKNWRDLDARSGGTAAPVGGMPGMPGMGGSPAGANALASILGGYNETQGFGQTAWANGGGAWMYSGIPAGYWGYEGGHNGLDLGAAYGAPIYSPVGGTVIQAGGGRYGYGPNGPNVPGEGEIKIRLDNGDEIAFGHTSRVNVQVGQRINPGMMIGQVGYMAGTGADATHLHLETYRKNGYSGNPMGLQLVDPRLYFSGQAGYAGYGSAGGGQGGYTRPQTFWGSLFG